MDQIEKKSQKKEVGGEQIGLIDIFMTAYSSISNFGAIHRVTAN